MATEREKIMSNIQDLYDFIEQAKGDRNYAPNTALGRRAALQLYEKQLTEEEKASTDVLHERLDRIAQVVDSKNKNFKTSTLIVYKKRMKNLLEDYKKYGQDSVARASWRGGRNTGSKLKRSIELKSDKATESNIVIKDEVTAPIFRESLHDLNVQLRPGLRITLTLPYDLKPKEADRLKMYIDASVSGEEDDSA